MQLGGATRGDKTMLDALGPFVESFEAAVSDGIDWRAAWSASVEVAQKSAAETAELRPKIGRARPLAERSVGFDRRHIVRVGGHDVDFVVLVGLQRHREVVDVLELDTLELGLAAPIILVGLELDQVL